MPIATGQALPMFIALLVIAVSDANSQEQPSPVFSQFQADFVGPQTAGAASFGPPSHHQKLQQQQQDPMPAKRHLLDLFSFFNKRRDAAMGGGFDALPAMHTRSLGQIRDNNCYFSPIQCYLEERKRKRRSAAPQQLMAQ